LIEDINLAVKHYQETNCDIQFSKIYHKVTEKWQQKIKTLSKRYGLDEQDVDEMMHFKLYQAAKTLDLQKGDFINLLNRSITLGCIDLVRKKPKNIKFEYLDDDDATIKETLSIANAETEGLESLQKNYEQRQLFATLVEFADNKTRQCLSAFNVTGSYQAAAKQLGTTRKTVRRRVTALSLKYDANRFGDIHDYFTAPTVKIAN
jgi:DNA-directed RNA polymerase specialized sigma24 family protein